MGRLTTHVLDTANGKPAAGIELAVYKVDEADGARTLLGEARTNADGRCDRPLLEGEELQRGVYEIVFRMADYFAGKESGLSLPPFVGDVVLRFGVSAPGEHYHVPLLVSPWSYSTYRGS